MPVIAIFSASHCSADEVARGVAERLEIPLVAHELLEDASRLSSLSVRRVLRGMTGAASLLADLTHVRERSIISVKAAMAERLRFDDLVYHGMAMHLIPRQICHVLRVCLVAERQHRIERAVRTQLLERRAAERAVRRSDEDLGRWTHFLFRRGPWDASLYDVKVSMHTTSVEDTVDLICENALREAVKPTRESLQAVMDFVLATTVNVALMRRGYHYCDVTARDGVVTVIVNKNVLLLRHLEKRLAAVALAVHGVKDARIRVGPQFNRPDIYRSYEFPMPPRILLVDDEEEFVTTLSERLEMRDYSSDVVYNGQEALSYVEQHEPEVMVLDLRMPGMGGIEVLQRIKARHPRVEVIILTGHGTERDRAAAMELGAFAYLEKPVDIDVLARTMTQASLKSRVARSSGASEASSDGIEGERAGDAGE